MLDGADLSDQIRPMIDDVVRGYVEGATADGYAEDWDLEQLWTALKTLYPVSLTIDEAIEQAGGEKSDLTREFLIEELVADAQAAYDAREEDLGLGGDARARAAGAAVGARPQVARAPLRDGLPAGGHRPAGDGPARPAGRVPARGLRHVRAR